MGELRVKLPGGDWKLIRASQGYVVPPGISFEVEAVGDVAYLCSYS